jgi:hypothetical protein
VLEPVNARYPGAVKRLYFRGDAAFGHREMYEFREAEGIGYTIRLQRSIGYLLKRPVGRPRHEVRRYDASFRYLAQSWTTPRPVEAKGRRARARSNGPGCHVGPWPECRPPSAPRPGLQRRQLHAHAGEAEGGAAVVADRPARETDRDRHEGR